MVLVGQICAFGKRIPRIFCEYQKTFWSKIPKTPRKIARSYPQLTLYNLQKTVPVTRKITQLAILFALVMAAELKQWVNMPPKPTENKYSTLRRLIAPKIKYFKINLTFYRN